MVPDLHKVIFHSNIATCPTNEKQQKAPLIRGSTFIPHMTMDTTKKMTKTKHTTYLVGPIGFETPTFFCRKRGPHLKVARICNV